MVTTGEMITVHERGPRQAGARSYAEEKIGRILKFAPRPILFCRVELEQVTNPAADRPSRAKGTIDVSGRIVRAQVAADDMAEAIDKLEARLGRQLRRLADKYQDGRKMPVSEPGEWQHGSLPTDRPAYFPRPPEERELVRHKTFALGATSREEAFANLDLLDYSFYLCRLDASGEDAVIYRDDGVEVVVLASSAPTLDVDQAVERLNGTDEPFVFFVNRQTMHASVVYRRYDGHYGLITPE